MIEELDKDYVTFAPAARGAERRAHHPGPMCCATRLIPVVTAAGLIIVGAGRQRDLCRGYLRVARNRLAHRRRGAKKRDIPMNPGHHRAAVGLHRPCSNLLIDVIYTLIDPRIRFGRVES